MTNINNQIPIFKFLVKHKWRIILPLLFATFYWAYPRYQNIPIAVQQDIFIKSSYLTQAEIDSRVDSVKKVIHSDYFLQNLIEKYDLYKKEREKNVDSYQLISKLRNTIEIRERFWEINQGTQIFIWINFKPENAENIAKISDDVAIQFENIKDVQMNRYFTKPYDANPYRNWVFFGALLQGFTLLTIPLILLWEIPNLFYSSRTKENIFEPLKTDWQDELTNAKLQNQTLKIVEINIRYSMAFISAMIQKSPLGDLLEYVRKFAS
jgi:hypothetical protein